MSFAKPSQIPCRDRATTTTPTVRSATSARGRRRSSARTRSSSSGPTRPVSASDVATPSPIEHVVIIVKENHGYDNYFGTFHGGNGVAMAHSPNPPPSDPDHRHAAWLTRDTTAPRVAFQHTDSPRYWSYASKFTLCDNYYTDVAGPSTPNHLMLIMADSALIDNPSRSYRNNPGPPLYDKPSLPAQLDAAALSWGNYNGYGFEYIKHTAGKKKKWQQFAADAAAGKLPSVSW